VALLHEPGVDLRDPKLSMVPEGRLMLVMGGSIYRGSDLVRREPRVAFSDYRGDHFFPTLLARIDPAIATGVDWLWRVTWRGGVGWGVVYQPLPDAWGVQLVRTEDGIDYRHVSTLAIEGRPNETTLRFLENGEMVALVRREGGDRTGLVGTSPPPHTEWSWVELPVRLGGPNFVVAPGGNLLAGTRDYRADGARTVLGRLDCREGSFEKLVTLPSGGDTSYPGLVVDDDRLLVSYYSSHEGRTAIYLASLRLDVLLEGE
jgi:hypothetical protein